MSTDFGKRIKAARKHADLTQVELSKAIGIKQSSLSHLESTAFCSTHTTQIAKACKVDPNWLATGEGDMIATDGVGTRSKFVENQSIELANALEKVEAALVSIKTSAASNNTVHLEHAWPFKNITRDQWLDLTDEQKAIVESVAAGMLTAHHSAGGGGQHDKRHAA